MAYYPTTPVAGDTIGQNLCTTPFFPNASTKGAWSGVTVQSAGGGLYEATIPVNATGKILLPNIPVTPAVFRFSIRYRQSNNGIIIGVRPVGSSRTTGKALPKTSGTTWVWATVDVTDAILAGDSGTGVEAYIKNRDLSTYVAEWTHFRVDYSDSVVGDSNWYFDGATPDTATYDYAWTGSSYLSTSVTKLLSDGRPDITTVTLGALEENKTMTPVTLTAAGNPPITWTAANLPPGLTFDGVDKISGTPTAAGHYSATLTATNSVGSDTQIITDDIAPPNNAPNITTTELGPLEVGTYAYVPIAYTGFKPVHFSAENLPPGLTLPAGQSYVDGVPLAAGPYSAGITITNQYGYDTDIMSGEVTPDPAPPNGYIEPPSWQAADLYWQYTECSEGYPTSPDYPDYRPPTSPPGRYRTIHGGGNPDVPAVARSSGINVLAVNAGDTVRWVFQISTATMENKPWLFQLVDTETGEVLAQDKVEANWDEDWDPGTGIPVGPLRYDIRHTLTAARIVGAVIREQQGNASGAYMAFDVGDDLSWWQLDVLPGGVVVKPKITTTTLDPLSVGHPASVTLIATGTPPIHWTAEDRPPAGNMPQGLYLAGDTITGTPQYANPYEFVVTATNDAGTDNATLRGEIGTGPISQPPFITTTTLDPLSVGTPTSVTLTATGTLPITWTAENLPDGLTLAGNTIGGTPTAAGPYSATLTATNADGTHTVTLDGEVTQYPAAVAPKITTATFGALYIDVAATVILTATGTPPITWTAENLPAGLTFDGVDKISGTPTAAGHYSATLTATNSAGTTTATIAGSVTAKPAEPPPGPETSGGTGWSILRDHVTLLLSTGKRVAYRAAVRPLTATEQLAQGRDSSSSAYSMVLVPRPGDKITAQTIVTWRGVSYSVDGPALLHTKNGIVHHAELTFTRKMG